jgi:CSLREA domain-containing protein
MTATFPVGGDVDGDLKADPGDTIKYTALLDNTSGTLAGTSLIFTDNIDGHTTLAGTWNSSPVTFDQSVSTNEDTAKSITLTGEDPDGTPLSLFTIMTQPAHGTLTPPGGTTAGRTYTPAADYNGPDSFTFKVNDGTVDSNQVGTVSITVVGVNDAPCFAATASPCVPALPGAQTFNEDTPRVFNTANSNRIRVSDVDSGASNVTFTASVLHGTINVSTAGVSVTNNNTASISVVGTVANIDTAINGLTYTPTLNYNGSDTLTLGINDGGATGLGGALSAGGTVGLTITAVNDAPVVANKSFLAKANMKIGYQINLAANGTGDVTDADNNDAGFTNTFTLTSVTGACTSAALPCTISITNASTGTFNFDPPPGTVGNVILNYTVTDNGRPLPAQVSAPGTITIAVSGPVIWFVDPTRANDGNGTLSDTSLAAGQPGPFKLLSSATAKLATLAPNQRVFVYSGTTTAAINANVGEVLTLKDNNWLIGQGTIGSDFDTLFGLTGGNAAPAGTIGRPSINGTRPTLQGTVTMANNTIVSGLNIDVSAAAAGSKGLKSSGFSAGTSAISDVNVKSAAGTAVDLSGTQTVTYTTSNSSTSPNILNSTAGGALSVVSTTIGSSGFNFQSISANGGANGIILTTIGSGPFSVTGIGTTAGSGGTIQNCTQHGAAITGTAASVVTMKNMNFTANGTNLSDPTTPSHCGDIFGTAFNTEAMCGAGISLTNIGSTGSAGSGTTLDRISVTNGQQVGINIQGGANVTLTNSTVSGNGNQVSENGLQALNLQGTMTITDSNFTNNAANQIDATLNSTATANLIFDIKGTAPGNSLIRGFTAWPTNGTSNAGIRLGSYASGRTLDFSATDVNFTNSFSAALLVRTDTGGHMVFDVLRGVFSDNGMNIDMQGQGSGNMTYTVDDITTNVNPAHTSVGSFTFAKGATASGNWNGTIKNCDIGTAGTAKSGSPFTGLRVISGTSGQYTATITNNIINEVGQHGIDMSSGKNISNDSGSFNWVVTGNTINATATAPLASGQAIFATAGTASGDSSCVHATIGGAGALKNTIGGTWSGSAIRLRNRFTTTNFFVVGYGGSTVGDNSAAIATFVSGQNGGVSTTATATDPSAVATPFNDLASCPLLLANGGVMAALNSPSLLSAIFSFPDRFTADILEGSGAASSPLDKSQLSQSITQDRLDSIVTAAIARWSATGLTTQQIATLRAIKFDVASLGGSYLGEAEGNLVLVDGDAQGKGWFIDATPQSDSEFGAATGTRRYTDPMSTPAGHVDLLTAIMHEMGHKLGLDDSYAKKDRDNLMYGYLTVGERRIPSRGQAATATPSQYASTHFLSLMPGDETAVTMARANVTAALVGETLKARTVAAPLSNAVAAFGATQKAKPVFAGASASLSGERTITSASQNQIPSQQPLVSTRAGIRLNYAKSWPGITTKTSARISSLFASPMPAGETVTVSGSGGAGFSLPIGKSTTITFNVTMNNPPNLAGVPPATPQVSNFGTLSGGFDGNPTNTNTATTPVDLFNSTTTVTSPGATNVNKPVTYTATVAATGSPAPASGTASGKMIFKDGGTTISGCGNADVINSVATCTTSPNSGGTHNITAFYSGDGSYDPSDNLGTPYGQSVVLSDVTVAVTSSSPSNTSLVGQNVTFTATVTSQTSVTGPPAGTVTFKSDGNLISCSNAGGQVLSGGVATCQTSALTAAGSPHDITAAYAGDGSANGSSTFNPNSGALSPKQTVNTSGTTTALASSANPSNVGQNVTFTATVSSATSVPGPPAGTVTFKSDGTTISCSNAGGQTLSGGVATCQTTALTSAGSPHDITANYVADAVAANGSAKFNNSSGVLAPKQTVNTSNTTTTLSSSSPSNTSLVTQNVTFTATVGSATPGTPEGTVTFKDNGSAITCTNGATSVQPLSGGVATCQTASLTAAGSPHDITGDYVADPVSANGSAKFSNSSGALSPKQTVNKSDTTTALAAPTPNPSNSNQQVTFTATVTSSGVTFTDTGTVAFKDSGSPMGCESEPIVAGQATCNTSSLPNGTRSITAVYSGDATFKTSTSAPQSQQVGPVCSNSVVVQNTNDNGAGSLRQAIVDVCTGGTITFNAALLTDQQITLTGPITLTTGGELVIDKNMTITGLGATHLTVQRSSAVGTPDFRIFNVKPGVTVTISDMTISNGNLVGAAGGPVFGGGILNAGTLTLQNAIVSGNHVTGGAGADGSGAPGGAGGGAFGGGISNGGTLTLTNTTVNGSNSATGGKGGNSNTAAGGDGGSAFGGGVYNNGTLTLTNSTVGTLVGGANTATGGIPGTGSVAGTAGFGSGGGVYNDASAAAASTTVTNTTISGNTAGQNGGGIYSIGNVGTATLSITGSTINGNAAGLNGGGVYNAGTVTSAPMSITNSTISGNTANNDGGGVYNDSDSGVVTITGATITKNYADNDSSLVGTGGGLKVVSGPVTLKDTIVAPNFVASLQVETATVTGGPITAGVQQVETLTVVVTSPPITTSGSGTVQVTINNATLPDKTVSLVNGDTAASIAIKIRNLLNADTAITNFFTAAVGTGANTADVILTANSAAANDASLLVKVIGCGTSPCTGLNNSDSVDTTGGTPASAGTKQAETMTVLNGPVSGCPGGAGNLTLVVTAVGMTNSGSPLTIPVNQGDTAAMVADAVVTFLASPSGADVANFFDVARVNTADVKFTAKTPAANDGTMNMTVSNGTCSGINSISVDSTAGVASFAGTQQKEKVTVTVTSPGGTLSTAGEVSLTVTAPSATISELVATATIPIGADAAAVAAAIQTALQSNTTVDGFFFVDVTGADVTIRAKTPAANDPLMNLSIDSCSCVAVTPVPFSTRTPGAAPSAGTKQVETLQVLSAPSGCPGGTTGTVSVVVIANGMTGSGTPFDVTVDQSDSAATVAGKIKTFLTGGGAPDVSPGFFAISGSGANVVFTANTQAPNDTTMNVRVLNGTCTVVTASVTSQSGVAPVVGVNQVDTATVSISSPPISTNATGIARITAALINAGAPKDIGFTVAAGDTAAAVAIKIRNALNGDTEFFTNYTASVGDNPNEADVIVTTKTPATTDGSLKLSIIGCGTSCPGLNSSDSVDTPPPGVAPGTGNAKVTITTTAGYFYAAGIPDGTKTIQVPVSASDTAAQVAVKIRDVLNNDSDVNTVFTATSENEKVRLTRKVIAPDDTNLTIAIDNDTSTGLSPSPPSENTRPGGSNAIHDDISGAVVGSYNLVGVPTGFTGIGNGDAGFNQVGTAGTPLDPKLNPLANNGGLTFTHSLQDDSPAIDKGDDFSGPPTTDQRGFPRPVDQLPDTTYPNVGDASDIGAFERQQPTTPPGTPVLTPAGAGSNPEVTRDSSPDFNIAVTTGATVELLRGGATVVATGVASTSSILLTDNTLTLDGTYSYSARQTLGGAPSVPSTAVSIKVDTAPDAPDLTTDSNVANDNITNVNQPTFNITNVSAGRNVDLLRNGIVVKSGTAAGTSIQLTDGPPAVADGNSYSYTARQTLGAFTGAESAALTPVVIDTNAPAVSTPVLDLSSDSGTAGDNLTNDTTPTMKGTAEPGSTVVLFADGNLVGTDTASIGGTWTITSIALSANGPAHVMTATAKDVAGNVSAASSGQNVTIDTVAPNPPSTPVLDAGSDSGTAGDNLTNDTTPTYTGTAEPGSTVKLFADGIQVGTVTAGGGGTWTITSSALTANGPVISITATATDEAGNPSSASGSQSLTLDTLAPNAPSTPVLAGASDSGTPGDNVTNSTTPTYTGTAEPNSTVQLFADGTLVGSGPASAGGAWSITSSTLTANGPDITITAKATDAAGNVSGASTGQSLTIDTIAPNAPSTPVLDLASDSGTTGDGKTSDTTPTFTGTAEPNSTVQLFATNVSKGSGAAAGGSWNITSSALAQGAYNITTTATDAAGNVSGASGGLNVIIDTTPPTVASIARFNPSATTTNATSVDFLVTFSEVVTGVDLSDFSVNAGAGITGASKTSVTPDPDGIHYTVKVNTGSGNGNLRLDVVDDNTIRDVVDLALGGPALGDGNFNTGQVYIVNKTSAFVNSIVRAGTNPTGAANVDFTVTFSTPVTGVDVSDFFVTTAGITGSPTIGPVIGSGTTYTVTVSTGTGTTGPPPNTIRLDLRDDDSIKDGANAPLGGVGVYPGGGAGDASHIGDEVYDIDKTAPTVTAAKEASQADPAIGPSATTNINFTVVFSETVTSFTSSAVQITGTATSGTTTASVSGSGTTYNVAVSGLTPPPSGTGSVTITVPAGAAPDPAGNANTASNSATVTFIKDDFSTLEVNSLADPGDGPCTAAGTGDGCTLREAINAANVDAGADTITFAPALTSGPPPTITLLTALPDITTDMTIQGPGSGAAANLLTVQRSNAAGRFRIFNTNSAAVTISRLIISGGFTPDGANNPGGTGIAGGGGGGILNSGTLTLTNVTVSGNQSGAGGNGMFGGVGGAGGGISNTGTLTLTGSTINGNQTGHGGDGNAPPPPNGAGGPGGGISNTGTLNVTNSTISGNQTGVGGSNGSSGNGGGIYTDIGTLALNGSTITLNSAGATGTGGGIYSAGGTVTLRNTIVGGGNTASSGLDILGTVQSDGFNLIQSTSGANINANPGAGPDITGPDPLLNALADNGGPTRTHSLQCTSPAIDKGTATLTTLAGAIDNAQTSINVTSAAFIPAGVGFVIVIDTEQMVVISKATNTLTVTRAANGTTAAAHASGAGLLPLNASDQRGGNRPFDLADSVYQNAPGGDGSEIGAYETQSGGGCLPEAISPDPQPSTSEDTAVEVTLRGEYAQNTNLTFTVTPPAHGSLGPITALDCQFVSLKTVCTAKVIYTPSANFNGLDTFKFKAVTNPGGLESEEADVNITVTSVNDPPVANGDALADIAEDSGVRTIPFADLLGNDAAGPGDESGQTLTIISVGSAVGGTVSIQGSNVLFTPAANFNGAASFKYTIRDDGTTNGAPDPKNSVLQATVVFNVTPTADTPSVTNATTNEDTQTTSGLVITRNAGDGAEVTNFKITGITNGTLFQSNGSTPINNGDFITVTQGNAGLKFTPAANLFSPTTTFSFQAQASLDNTDAGLGGGLATATITVNAIADTPSVTNATTSVNTQTTSGLVISRNAADSTEVTNFKITNIQNGTLFKNNGTTQINNNDFITAAEGNAGLKFTPGTNLLSPGTTFSFDVQASTSNANAGLGGSVVTATITVSCGGSLVVNNNDSGAGSLRAILLTACPGTTITFAPGVVGPITLTSGELVVDKNLTINGPGANILTISGISSSNSRVFRILSGNTVTMTDLTIANGQMSGSGNNGGGVLNNGTLTLNNCNLFGNATINNRGGGIYNDGTSLTLNNCNIGGTLAGQPNTAPAGGGGIYHNSGTLLMTGGSVVGNSNSGIAIAGGTATLNGVAISNNSINGGGGGGIAAVGGTTSIINCLIVNNVGGNSGGGVSIGSTAVVTMVNSTISGNSTSNVGGGVSNQSGNTTLTNVTITNNRSENSTGGGIFASSANATTTLRNTIVAGNFGGASPSTTANNISGTVSSSSSFNLIGTGGAGGLTNGTNNNQVGVANPGLGVLANNGGPTLTHALLAGSPALDAGDNAAVVNPPFSGVAPFNDQRGPGFLRIRDAADVNTAQTVDIGAFEADPSIEDISDKSTIENSPVSFTFNLGDAATAFDSITGNSSNTTLLPNANIQFSGSGSSRTMTLTPAANTSGSSTITVTVTKTLGGAPRSMSDTFLLGVNDGGTLQFSSGIYSVVENAGPGAVTITRTGGTAGTATVQVATSNGTAVAGTDYTAVSQTVTFNDGETSKVVTVPITDNLNNQPNRTVNLTLSNVGGSGQLGAPITAVLTILDNDPTGGYIRFSSSTYTVGEGAGAATITVERLGTLTQPVTVDYATSDDSNPPSQVPCGPTPGNTTATSRCDFNTAIGRLSFAAGDGTPKTFTVLINQDTYLEGPEGLPLTLSNLTGGATFASPSTATLNITDDDLVAPTTNTIDDPASFVKQHYRDFLNREADAAGLAFWTNQITSCGTDAQCIEVKRVNVSAAFFLSIEFQVTGGTAYLTNRAAYGGLPNYVRFETDAQALGRNYVFGQPGAEGILEANKVAYFNEYVTRTEFTDTYNGETDESYVNTLISNTGVTFTQLERDALINGLANHTETRATVLRKIAEKPSFRQAEFNSMFVLMEYYGYLHRNPDTAGFNFWLNKLNQFNGNFIQADMVKAFINSAEYRQRFGP